jgi:hypothetical protein
MRDSKMVDIMISMPLQLDDAAYINYMLLASEFLFIMDGREINTINHLIPQLAPILPFEKIRIEGSVLLNMSDDTYIDNMWADIKEETIKNIGNFGPEHKPNEIRQFLDELHFMNLDLELKDLTQFDCAEFASQLMMENLAKIFKDISAEISEN